MNAFVVSGLIKRRAELAGDIVKAHEALRMMVRDLKNPEGVLAKTGELRHTRYHLNVLKDREC